MLADGLWAMLEPLSEACQPAARVAPQNLRQTIGAIIWRHQNGAKWPAIPEVMGPWWEAAQMFIRWSRLGVWERLLLLAQKGRVAPGMTFLDGTNSRAHQKAAGAPPKTRPPCNGTDVKHWAGLGVASAPPCGASVSFAA